MINVQIKIEGLDKVDTLLSNIRNRMPFVADQTVGHVGQKTTALIRKAVNEGRIHPPLSNMTMRKREIGKFAGTGGPAIPRYGSKRVLYRSGAMAKAVRYRHRKTGHWQMDINPIFGEYSGGKQISLAHIAYLQETGYKMRIAVTHRMLRYLYVLMAGGSRVRGGRGLKGKSSGPDTKTGKFIEATVLPRPIFTQHFDSISNAQFDAWIIEGLKKNERYLKS